MNIRNEVWNFVILKFWNKSPLSYLTLQLKKSLHMICLSLPEVINQLSRKIYILTTTKLLQNGY